jgi:sec-independent protein translocase protein TatB
MANGAKDRMREEMGPDFDDVDWKKLDPRQYDPRRIIREALLDDEPEPTISRPTKDDDETSDAVDAATVADVDSGATTEKTTVGAGADPPFDSEAT